MTLFEIYSNIRADILKVIGGTKNASQYGWDNTTPNYMTRHHINRIIAVSKVALISHGIYLVNRYSGCRNPAHKKKSIDGYIMEKIGEKTFKYGDPNYHWKIAVHQGDTIDTCPCSKENKEEEIYFIKDILFEKEHTEKTCDDIEYLYYFLYDAWISASDKSPRSSIRECLFRALLKTNDLIMPISVDDYIKSRSPLIISKE